MRSPLSEWILDGEFGVASLALCLRISRIETLRIHAKSTADVTIGVVETGSRVDLHLKHELALLVALRWGIRGRSFARIV